MPIYEYECDSCNEVFEVMQKFSDEPLKVHEKCGGSVHRLISPSAFQFKGSGWYVTDYAKNSGGKSPANGSGSAGGESKASENGSAKSEKPSESKAAESKPSSSTSSSSSTTSSATKQD